MSLDNIQLSPFLVQELYKESLLISDNQLLKPKLPKNDQLSYLGKNEKNILLIVHEKNALYLPDEDLHLLIGILNACGLTLSDTALLNFNQHPEINYQSLLAKFQPEFILLFGIEPKDLDFPLQFPHYQVQKYNNQVYFSAPSLNELGTDMEQKKLFWNGLQKFFLFK